ncbi:PD-(D/E)XK nuclease family protein [Haloferula sp.]|uniref:PD-(D/E)XK nuclease family protein n=1 Tax=Haloferula sp. TaxID=2497595 RepID=UPI003C784361
MKTTFGLSLDGCRPSKPVFDHLFCGPLGLVDVLELRLGLPKTAVGVVTRIAQFLKVLEHASSEEDRFFTESLRVDRWGTASRLLQMRDHLRMAGWNGGEMDSAPARLKDFCEVERLAEGRLTTGIADRIERIRGALSRKPQGLPTIECIEAAEHLPLLLRLLLDDLGARFGCDPTYEDAPVGSNLRLVQDCLTGHDVSGQTWNPADDSIIFASAFSEVTLAQANAHLVKSDSPSSVLLSSAPGIILTDALNVLATPAPAMGSPSCLRPTMQVLGLALEMRWDPPDPSVLLQFLTHPVCPIGSSLRHALAKAVSSHPGIGSHVWNDAIEMQREKLRSDEDLTQADLTTRLDRIDSDLAQWIMIDRSPRQTGASGAALAETAKQVGDWAGRRTATSSDPATARHYATLSSIAVELAEILEKIPNVSPEELSIIREQVMGGGTVAGDRESELGSPESPANPGAIIESADSVIWWGFEAHAIQLPMDWTLTERNYMEGIGVHHQTPEVLLALAQAAARRPFLAASRSIVLLWPRQRGLEQVEPHPILTILRASFPSIPIKDLDRDELAAVTSQVKIQRQVKPLPAKKRWVRISPTAHLGSRPEESYSSTTKFIHRPFEWVFYYKANLRKGAFMEINLAAQRGNLLHRVIERLLEDSCPIQWLTVGKPEFDSWLNNLWYTLLEIEGANFLLPGSLTEGRRLLEDARRSIWELLGQMRKAGVVSAEADVHEDPLQMEDTTIRGNIDLLATNGSGRLAVVDLKFGQAAAKRSELAKNTALQLATYSHLIRSKHGGDWPATAYFILRNSTLLAQDASFFPDARVVPCKSLEPGPEATWHTFLDVWRWRRGQLDAGWIEIPDKGIEPTDGEGDSPSSTPPHEEWQTDVKAPRYDDYQFLTGWEVNP